MKGFTDLLYGTRRVRNSFARDNPEETVLAADACKGIVKEMAQDIRRGVDWVTSQRAVVLLTDQRIVCGKWTIPLRAISAAQLVSIRSLLGGGQVLKIQTEDGKHYQFGMRCNPEWTNQQALPLVPEEGRLQYSVFSVVIRLLLIAFLFYWLYEKFLAG